jgi:hypothetical protein
VIRNVKFIHMLIGEETDRRGSPLPIPLLPPSSYDPFVGIGELDVSNLKRIQSNLFYVIHPKESARILKDSDKSHRNL